MRLKTALLGGTAALFLAATPAAMALADGPTPKPTVVNPKTPAAEPVPAESIPPTVKPKEPAPAPALPGKPSYTG